MQTQMNDWLEKAKQEAEEKIKEENKFFKLTEGDNLIELDLSTEPEKILNRFGSKVYMWKTTSNKNFQTGLYLHHKILQLITPADMQAKKISVLIKKTGVGQNTKYEVSRK